jgi:hypothetical protein
MNKLTPFLIVGMIAIGGGLSIARGDTDFFKTSGDYSMHGMQKASFESASTKAYREANVRMHKNMTESFTGNADVDFMRGMIAHHQGGIDMASVPATDI